MIETTPFLTSGAKQEATNRNKTNQMKTNRNKTNQIYQKKKIKRKIKKKKTITKGLSRPQLTKLPNTAGNGTTGLTHNTSLITKPPGIGCCPTGSNARIGGQPFGHGNSTITTGEKARLFPRNSINSGIIPTNSKTQ